MANRHIIKIKDYLIQKRKEQINNCQDHISSNNHHHMCCILDKSGEILSYGYNIYNIKTPTTEHAEAQAFRKLAQKMGAPSTTKKIKVDVLVVRVNGSNSKPCARCIEKMQEMSNIFSIKNIYYTHKETLDGLKCEKFSDLLNDPDKHISSYDRHQMKKKGINGSKASGITLIRSNSYSSINSSDSDSSEYLSDEIETLRRRRYLSPKSKRC